MGPREQEQEQEEEDHHHDDGIAGFHLRLRTTTQQCGNKELDELESHVNRSRFSNMTSHNCARRNDESCLQKFLFRTSSLRPSYYLRLESTWVDSTWPILDSPELTFLHCVDVEETGNYSRLYRLRKRKYQCSLNLHCTYIVKRRGSQTWLFITVQEGMMISVEIFFRTFSAPLIISDFDSTWRILDSPRLTFPHLVDVEEIGGIMVDSTGCSN